MWGNNIARTSSNIAFHNTTKHTIVHWPSPHQSTNHTVDSSNFSLLPSKNLHQKSKSILPTVPTHTTIIKSLPKETTSLILTIDFIVPTTSSCHYQKTKQSSTTPNLPRTKNQKIINLDPNTIIKNIISDLHIHNPQRSTTPSTPQSTPINKLHIYLSKCAHLQSLMYESDHLRSNNIVQLLFPPILYYILKNIVADKKTYLNKQHLPNTVPKYIQITSPTKNHSVLLVDNR